MGTKWLEFEIRGPQYFVKDFVEVMDLLDMAYNWFYIEGGIQEYDKLEINQIRTTSFEISLKGLWDGIDKLVELLNILPEIFTPTYWEKKREELKTQKMNNELIEMEIAKKKVELVRELIKISKDIPEDQRRLYSKQKLLDQDIQDKGFIKALEKRLTVKFLREW